MTDIPKLYSDAQDKFGWPDFVSIQAAGLSAEILSSLVAAKAIGAEEISVQGKRWQKRFRGQRVIILPVCGPATGEVVDLVAFNPKTPKAFWVHTGAGVMLGEVSAARAEHFSEPLYLHETPMDWLKAAGEGSVILDWKHYWPLYMGSIKRVRVLDEAFGKRAADLMARPFPTPEIEVAL
jgi:hypothetical protein